MKGYGQKRYLQKIITSLNRNDKSTTNVVLNGFHISDAKIALLAMALVHNTHLETLHLDGNKISDRGAVLLAYALKHNNTLEFVSLNDNLIRSSGADAIAYALHENKSLKTLRLANNFVGDHGARALRNMMKHNEYIKEVILEGNSISQKMAYKCDNRCRIQNMIECTDCDNTAASTAALSQSTSCELYQSADDHRQVEEKVQLNNSRVEWVDTRYNDSGDSMTDIPQEDLQDVSWDNLALYMMTVQNSIEKRDKDGENDGIDTICSNDEDILSVASSQSNKVSVEEGNKKKKWSIFKKKKQISSTKRPK